MSSLMQMTQAQVEFAAIVFAVIAASAVFLPVVRGALSAMFDVTYRYGVQYLAWGLGLKFGNNQMLMRYGLLIGWLVGLSAVAALAPLPIAIVASLAAVFAVITVSWEWSVNEAHREALMLHGEGDPRYWLPANPKKPGLDARQDIDNLPDLWDEAIVSAVLIFPLSAFLGAVLLVDAPGFPKVETLQLWFAHAFDRLLTTLPIDILEFFNAQGFAETIGQREPNTIAWIGAFDLALSLTLTFVFVTGFARIIQRNRLVRLAASSFDSNPAIAARLGKHRLQDFTNALHSEPVRPDKNHARYSQAMIHWMKERAVHGKGQLAVRCVDALGLLAPQDTGNELLNLLRSSQDDKVLAAACRAVERLFGNSQTKEQIALGQFKPVLIQLMSRPDGLAPEAAAHCLIAFNDPATRNELAALLPTVSDYRVRIPIIKCLGNLRSGFNVAPVLVAGRGAAEEAEKRVILSSLADLNIGQKQRLNTLVFVIGQLDPQGDLDTRLAAARTIAVKFDDETYDDKELGPARPLLDRLAIGLGAANRLQETAEVRALINTIWPTAPV